MNARNQIRARPERLPMSDNDKRAIQEQDDDTEMEGP